MRNIRIICVEPKHPENIGAIARTCYNFGVEELYLVNPLSDPREKKALDTAVNGRELLINAHIVNKLNMAIAECHQVWASSDHAIGMKKLSRLDELTKSSLAIEKKTGILMGREDIGLKKEEIQWCQGIITIPTPSEDNVLNIAQALSLIFGKYGSIPVSLCSL